MTQRRTYLVVYASFFTRDGVKVVHMDLSIIPLSFLRVLRRYMKVNMREMPPMGEPF